MTNPVIESDDILFADDGADDQTPKTAKAPWKIMIVDDDDSIHQVTLLSLTGFSFAGRGVTFIQCYSGKEAKAAMAEHPDTALILLDVVMEDDHAGLDVVRHVRDELLNRKVRIVLRTGQPGQAPEHKVVSEYDINDYKEKTELTVNKLYTLLHAALRSYRDIETIERSKQGLADVIDASASIFKITSMNKFTHGALEQLTSLMHIDPGAIYMSSDGRSVGGFAAGRNGSRYEVIAGTGRYKGNIGADVQDLLEPDEITLLDDARIKRANNYGDDSFLGFFSDRTEREHLLYLKGIEELNPLDRDLIELFTRNISIALENISLHEDLEKTQREIVYLLGDAVETRSLETGNHVKRVAEISKLLALSIGVNPEQAEILKFASPLHDVGKIGIPDAILNKPGRHTDEERAVMQTHAVIGYNMLKSSQRRVLQAGAIVAHEHHERWDGEGYPNGKKGNEIDLFGRITAVADVFDALGSDRCYKKAWRMEDVLDLFRKEEGKQFDPTVVTALFANLEKIKGIQNEYADVLAA